MLMLNTFDFYHQFLYYVQRQVGQYEMCRSHDAVVSHDAIVSHDATVSHDNTM